MNIKICNECNTAFTSKDKYKKFCNQSCAAKYNNRNRSIESRQKQKESIRKTLKSDERLFYFGKFKNYCKVTFTNCILCNAAIRKVSKSSVYCKSCKKEKILPYRRACKFKFTEQTNPELFDQELIKKHGWYKPSNSKAPNLNGLTWDHLFKIEDGFRLGVDPEIMSHHANAELVTWRENYSRHLTGSSLTYKELLQRILDYEKN